MRKVVINAESGLRWKMLGMPLPWDSCGGLQEGDVRWVNVILLPGTEIKQDHHLDAASR